MSRSRHGLKGQHISSIPQDDVTQKVSVLEDKLKDLEKCFDGLEQDIAGILKTRSQKVSATILPVEQIWKCCKCGLRLGVYDPQVDLLRVRYKDFYAYFKAGEGGFTKVICRSCSHINQVNYIDKDK